MRIVTTVKLGLAAAALLAGGMAANAAVIVYTLNGVFSGTSAMGGDFQNVAATLTAYGDTDWRGHNNVGTQYVGITSASITTATSVIDLANPDGNFFAVNNGWKGAGFGQGTIRLSFNAPFLASYDGVSDLAATPVDFLATAPFASSLGTISLSSERDLTFSAHLVASVPEPAAWATMIAGFAIIGGALRVRRRRVAFA